MNDLAEPVAIKLPPGSLHLCNRESGTLMVFHADGRVTADPRLKADEAARAIIAALLEHGWLKYAPAASAPDRTITGGLRESGDYTGIAG